MYSLTNKAQLLKNEQQKCLLTETILKPFLRSSPNLRIPPHHPPPTKIK